MSDENVCRTHDPAEARAILIFGLWPKESCPYCRAKRVGHMLDEARPVLEAARFAAGVFAVMPLDRQGIHIRQLVEAVRAYDAARAAGEDKP